MEKEEEDVLRVLVDGALVHVRRRGVVRARLRKLDGILLARSTHEGTGNQVYLPILSDSILTIPTYSF